MIGTGSGNAVVGQQNEQQWAEYTDLGGTSAQSNVAGGPVADLNRL